MNKQRYFMIIAGAIGVCVLLFLLFAVTVLGMTFNSAGALWVLLALLFVGAAQIYCFYQIFYAEQASSLLLPYKLLLLAITYLFTVVELMLIVLYLKMSILSYLQGHVGGGGVSRFLEKLPFNTGDAGSSLVRMLDTGRPHVSAMFVLCVLLAAVLYVAVYATVLYLSGIVRDQQEEDAGRQAIERDIASRLTETLHAYREFARSHGGLNLAAAEQAAAALSLKARSVRGLGDYRHADLEHRIIATCNELLDAFGGNRGEAPIDQQAADDIGGKLRAILHDFSQLDQAIIK